MRSPASGVRRQSPHAVVLGGSVPMLLRTRIEARSGMEMGFGIEWEKPFILKKARNYRIFHLASSYPSIPSSAPTP